MSSYALALSPARSLVAADLLKLRKRRGLVAVSSLLTIGATVVTYAVMELLHVANPAKHGPAGGIVNLGHVAFLASLLGAVVATLIASSAAVGDLDAGVYRDLVVTGRSRLSLYLSRIPAGFLFLLPFVAASYALAAVASVAFAGSEPGPGLGLLTTTGLWVLVEVAFYYLLAFGIACLVGSRAYTIGIVLAWKLALTPILASISALGIVRELVPGVGLQDLAPAALGNAVRQVPDVGMTTAAIAAVLLVWMVSALVAGVWRDTTRDA
jgi:ABC-type transport system involved in multi-copper enzyme maturation permease subunit